MARTYSLSFASELNASSETVWAAVGTMKGVNDELRPWLRMTAPPEAAALRIEDAPLRTPMFSSWVLLGGVVPVDRHHFMLAAVERGRAFWEESTSWSQKRWEHRRRVAPRGKQGGGEEGCILTDALMFTPRVSALGPVLEWVIAAIFRHRHRRLRERFGELTSLS